MGLSFCFTNRTNFLSIIQYKNLFSHISTIFVQQRTKENQSSPKTNLHQPQTMEIHNCSTPAPQSSFLELSFHLNHSFIFVDLCSFLWALLLGTLLSHLGLEKDLTLRVLTCSLISHAGDLTWISWAITPLPTRPCNHRPTTWQSRTSDLSGGSLCLASHSAPTTWHFDMPRMKLKKMMCCFLLASLL